MNDFPWKVKCFLQKKQRKYQKDENKKTRKQSGHDTHKQKIAPIRRYPQLIMNKKIKAGDNLLSRSSGAALPSADEVLTVVFGMGTGVSPRL